MRFYEFADAQAQLDLLRTIIDSTWTAIANQAEQEKRAEAQRKANAKIKPRKRRAAMGKTVSVPIRKPPSPPSPAKPKPKAASPLPASTYKAALPTAQANLAQPYSGAVSRLNNASFGGKSHTLSADNGL